MNDDEVRAKLKAILRDGGEGEDYEVWEANLWCGCYEGDFREYFNDRREKAIADILKAFTLTPKEFTDRGPIELLASRIAHDEELRAAINRHLNFPLEPTT